MQAYRRRTSAPGSDPAEFCAKKENDRSFRAVAVKDK